MSISVSIAEYIAVSIDKYIAVSVPVSIKQSTEVSIAVLSSLLYSADARIGPFFFSS